MNITITMAGRHGWIQTMYVSDLIFIFRFEWSIKMKEKYASNFIENTHTQKKKLFMSSNYFNDKIHLS